jgi:signal transduction histidine kinase
VVLRQAGLRPAVETVLASLPLTVRLQVPQQRFDAVAETTAYYVICEALTNVVKHAEADEATVTVTATVTATDADADAVTVGPAHRHLVVEVADDGRGGADVRGGTGLAGLDDRLRDLGGDLTIHSPVHGGTQLRARIPCA